MKSMRVVVAGAGIGGLTAAIGLRQGGHQVTILEQAGELSEVGAGIYLAPNATRSLFALGLRERMEEVAYSAQHSLRRRWENGLILGSYPLGDNLRQRFGSPGWHIHRADLHSLLVEAAVAADGPGHPVELHLNSRVVDVDPGIGEECAYVLTTGNRRHRADLVIGADGVRSTVRDAVFGEPQYIDSGDLAFRLMISRDHFEEDSSLTEIVGSSNLTLWLGPERHIAHYYIRDQSILTFVCVVPRKDPVHEGLSGPDATAALLVSFEGWDSRVLRLVSSASVSDPGRGIYDIEPLTSWTKGRVCLLGDAVHAMWPYQAQGAAQAIEDAVVLGRLLDSASDVSLQDCLQQYEAVRKPRASTVHAASRLNRSLFHMPDGPEQEMRDAKLSAASGDYDSYEWLWGFDALKELPE